MGFGDITYLKQRLDSLEARLGALAEGGKLRQTGGGADRVGVPQIHGHLGTGDAGILASGTGFLHKLAASYEHIQSKLDATVAPTADEDSNDGYAIGSLWIDITADKGYLCLDASVAAAVWTETTGAGGGGGGTHEFSDVFFFTTSPDVIAIASGTFNLPAAPFGLIALTGEGGAPDILDDILTNGGSTTLVPGTRVCLTNLTDAITLQHSLKLVLGLGSNVVLDDNAIDWVVLQAISTSVWLEYDRSPSLIPNLHAEDHDIAKHTGIVGQRQVEILIPLTKPLPAATNNATLDDDYLYKKPYNVARRINKWYVRFESNLAAQATFQLKKNGTQITGAEITVSAAARDAAIDSFTEVTLASDDYLEVFQTAGNAEDIGGKVHVYGDEDVVAVVS